MNKAELIKAIAAETNKSQAETQLFVEKFINVVTGQLVLGGDLMLVGFGKFEVVHRKERKGRNPRTGEAIDIPASKAIRFSTGKLLQELVNEE